MFFILSNRTVVCESLRFKSTSYRSICRRDKGNRCLFLKPSFKGIDIDSCKKKPRDCKEQGGLRGVDLFFFKFYFPVLIISYVKHSLQGRSKNNSKISWFNFNLSLLNQIKSRWEENVKGGEGVRLKSKIWCWNQ